MLTDATKRVPMPNIMDMEKARVNADARRDLIRIPIVWAVVSAALLWLMRDRIATITFLDADDVMRMKQVLDLLHGQSWWDLRQYAVDPPHGTNMHWSRLVDIPLLAILRPALAFMGRDDAMRLTAATAPLLPLLPTMFALAYAARRLVDPRAGMLAAICLAMSGSTMTMMTPLRIDHHGWQICLGSVMLAALVGERTWRTGLVAGIACGLSLNIGMENSPLVAITGAIIAGRWMEKGETAELRAFAGSLLVLLPAGYELLQPWGNSAATCDALTPVWTTDGTLACSILLGATLLRTGPKGKAGAVLATLATVAIWHVVRWPGCALPVDVVGDQAQRLWLDHNSETKPLFALDGRNLAMLGIPTAIAIWVMWDALHTDERRRWIAPAAMFAMCLGVSLWRIRGVPMMQATANPAVTYMAWSLIGAARNIRAKTARYAVTAAIPVIATGWMLPGSLIALQMLNLDPKLSVRDMCMEGTRIEKLREVTGGTALADLNMSPYIALFSQHPTLAGPYHRDWPAIVDLILVWREPPARARAEVKRRHIDLIVDCRDDVPANQPGNLPNSFRNQLWTGHIPWARPVTVPRLAPILAWRVDRDRLRTTEPERPTEGR